MMPHSSFSYRVGAARECVTPSEPLWLAGYAARTGPARGKISDLNASAVAFEDDTGQRFVIASVDLIAITPTISKPVYDVAFARHGLRREQVLLTATHTHYGPEFRPDKAFFFNIPPEYAAKLPAEAERLANALSRAIDAAWERLLPARLFFRSTTANFAHNRRRHGVKDGLPSAEDVVDHDVPVLDCVDPSGRRVAIIFGYACHNTTIPPDDYRYCGDWAGFTKERLEAANDGAVALFIPGAGADQDPEPSGSLELSQQYGRELADAIQRCLEVPGAEVSGPIRVASADVDLPLQAVTRELLQTMIDSGDPPRVKKGRFLLDQIIGGETLINSYSVPLQVVAFGRETLLITLSGEPVVDWAISLKAAFEQGERSKTEQLNSPRPGFSHVWVAGYCNDMFGYLPTRRVLAEGGYEAGRATLWSWLPAPFTADVEDRIMAATQRLVEVVSC
jgi:neutral ceramidase